MKDKTILYESDSSVALPPSLLLASVQLWDSLVTLSNDGKKFSQSLINLGVNESNLVLREKGGGSI